MKGKAKTKRLRLNQGWILVFLAIAICGLILFATQTALGQRPNPLPQDPLIQVYFNQNLAKGADYTDPYRQIKRPGDNFEQIIIDNINKAQSSIDLAVQELRLPLVAQALVKKQQAGVKVRVILENTYNFTVLELFHKKNTLKTSDSERDRTDDYTRFVDKNNDGTLSEIEQGERDAIQILRNAQVPTIDDTEEASKRNTPGGKLQQDNHGTGLMHHKFLVIDQQNVIVTSANFTLSDQHGDYTNPKTRGNDNNLLVIQSPELAQIFTEEFNIMWGDGVGGQKDGHFGANKPHRPAIILNIGNTKVTIKFSPDKSKIGWENTTNGLIGQTLAQAQKQINLALFVFSEQSIANTLQERHNQGIEIKVLIDPGFAYRPYSEGLDLMGVSLKMKCQEEKDNQPWFNPIQTVGIPAIPEGDKLHNKLGIVDNNIVITGSHNWSNGANYINDETLLVLDNPDINAHYQRAFAQLYQNAELGLPKFVKTAIAKQEKECPSIVNTQTQSNSNHTQSNSSNTQPTSVSTGLININTASQEELDRLPGIGPKLAERIILARKQQPFTSLEDLKRVEGIKDSKLNKLTGKVVW